MSINNVLENFLQSNDRLDLRFSAYSASPSAFSAVKLSKVPAAKSADHSTLCFAVYPSRDTTSIL